MVLKRLAPMVNFTDTLDGKVRSTMLSGILMAVIGTSTDSSVSTSGYTASRTISGTIFSATYLLDRHAVDEWYPAGCA